MTPCSLIVRMKFRSHWVLVTILFNTIFSVPLELNSEPVNMNETLDVDETLAECYKINMLQSRFQLYFGIKNNEWNKIGTVITKRCQLQKIGSKPNGKYQIFCRVSAHFATVTLAGTPAGKTGNAKMLRCNFTSLFRD